MTHYAINRVVIVGGGTAGWMAAASLSRHFRKTDIQLTVVESSAIGTVGVGEATIPTLRRFYAELGYSDAEVIRRTQGTCKLGIEFQGWAGSDSAFIHPFGLFGQKANGIDFHHYWLHLKALGEAGKLEDYSLGVQLARHHKFAPPSPNPPSELSVFDWALHLDATAFGQLMREYAERHGVQRIDARIDHVVRDGDGSIERLQLDSGDTVGADLFIDCSGFKGLLIEQTLETGYEDWSRWLKCDSALAVQSERTGDPPPYTVCRAQPAGWQWRIPLQHRAGNGHVYASGYTSDEEALDCLKAGIDDELLHEPRSFRFTAGRRRLAWNKNCIAVGLAAGFLEPLESTSIALVETAIGKIRHAFQKPWYTRQIVDTFNEQTATEYERVRDFLILHYKLNGRDGAFWDDCRAMEVPEPLAEKMVAFKARGALTRYPLEIFGPPSWMAIYSGFDCLPEWYDPNVKRLAPDYLQHSFRRMRESVARAVEAAPSHSAFLRECEGSDV